MVREGGSTSPVNVWKASNSSSTKASSSNSPSPVADVRQETTMDVAVRKRPQRKKLVTTGAWPCKIHGCNKQFAREADLKRHQRTTKMHSMPSFSCPQCYATFTRTDALRRHQKSRHNGVVIEPVDQTQEPDENLRSRSGTPPPSRKKEKPQVESLPVPVTQTVPSHAGPSSYYRSHTANISPYIPPCPQQLTRGTQITHPTSDTRTAPWPTYLSSWQNSPLTQYADALSYVPVYQPSPHYRPHTTAYPCPIPLPPFPENSAAADFSSARVSKDSTAQPPSVKSASSDRTSVVSSSDTEARRDMEKQITAEEVVAAVEAALRQAARQSSEFDGDDDGHVKPYSPVDRLSASLDDHMEEGFMELCDLTDYGSTLADHILTEDGEPMLNPAELLTQESLASPPPS